MSYRDWHAGMKLVCIKEEWDEPLPRYPVLRRVYTINSVRLIPAGYVDAIGHRMTKPAVMVTLKEFHPLLGWNAEHFRPVQERKTDISVFTAMLTGKKKRVRA